MLTKLENNLKVEQLALVRTCPRYSEPIKKHLSHCCIENKQLSSWANFTIGCLFSVFLTNSAIAIWVISHRPYCTQLGGFYFLVDFNLYSQRTSIDFFHNQPPATEHNTDGIILGKQIELHLFSQYPLHIYLSVFFYLVFTYKYARECTALSSENCPVKKAATQSPRSKEKLSYLPYFSEWVSVFSRKFACIASLDFLSSLPVVLLSPLMSTFSSIKCQ